MLNSIHQFKVQAHRLDRSRSAQEINKHVADGINKDREIKEATDFSKSEAEMVDVMGKRWPRTLHSCKKEIDTRNTNNATVALINSFQRTVLKRITEQITDVSRGNTAALVVIDQFLLKLGTQTIIENVTIPLT